MSSIIWWAPPDPLKGLKNRLRFPQGRRNSTYDYSANVCPAVPRQTLLPYGMWTHHGPSPCHHNHISQFLPINLLIHKEFSFSLMSFFNFWNHFLCFCSGVYYIHLTFSKSASDCYYLNSSEIQKGYSHVAPFSFLFFGLFCIKSTCVRNV